MHHKLVKDGRIAALIVLMLILLTVYAFELYQLQIIEGEKYYNQSNEITTEERAITAARGNILDRYGRVLVSNTEVYNLTIDTTKLFANEDPNKTILDLVSMVESYGDKYTDDLPITSEPPFEYDEDMTEIQRTMLKAYIVDKKSELKELAVDPENPTAVELMSYMRTRYEIDNSYSAKEMRMIAGVRYSINVRYAINTADYVFVENASTKLITSIMENKLAGTRELYDVEKIQTNDNQTKSGVIDAWIDCLKNHTAPAVTGEDALCAMRAVFASLRSSELGAAVEIPENK